MDSPKPCARRNQELTILVAEDNEINQKLIQRILQTAGHRVDMVANGLQAVEFSSRTPYDLILMDIQMPLMDGYEAAKLIRKAEGGLQPAQPVRKRYTHEMNTDFKSAVRNPQPEIRAVPIIAMTGNDIKAEIEKCRSLGMNDCIGKPLFRDQLLSLIKKWTVIEPDFSASGPARKDGGLPSAKESGGHPPIDLDRALSEFMGEKAVLRDLLKEFTEKVRSQITAIQQAAGRLDYQVVAKEAHSIKGGAANLTADKMAAIAAGLEKAADLQQADQVRHLAGQLEEKHQQLETYLQAKLVSVRGVEK